MENFEKEKKIENEKKKNIGEAEKRKTLGKTSITRYFFKNQMVSKRRGNTELECKTGVKHNSKFKKIHFQKLTYLLEKRKSTKGIEKNQVDISIRTVCWFEKVEKHETGDAGDVKGDKNKKRREDKTI